MEKGLEYVFDKNTKILIVGTFPSVKSRGEFYYNHPKNLFWKIMGEIYKNNDILPPQNADTDDHELIEKRKEFLSAHKIGLWDIIKTCDFENKSSLDAKIINNSIVFNDFSILQKKCPNLKCIVFSSKNAYKFFKKYLKQKDIYPGLNEKTYLDWLEKVIIKTALPSTSPAYAAKHPDDKIKEWKDFFRYYLKYNER